MLFFRAMVRAEDVLFGFGGLLLTVYGSQQTPQNLFTIMGGIGVVVFSIYLHLQQQEKEIGRLKDQIDTQLELKRIWREIDELKHIKK